MPLVKVNMLEGKTPDFKMTVFDCIHEELKPFGEDGRI